MAKAPTKETKVETSTEEVTESRSVVNPKYKGKYKRGTGSPTALFIEKQCLDENGEFNFENLFAICRANGINEEKVAHYEKKIANNDHGAPGLARMTLGNMLASVARKEQKLVDLKGRKQAVEQPAIAATGAAKAAKEGAKAA